jgi:phospholipase/carboxylesterase
MHGLGSDEQDMFGLAQVLDPSYEIVCLRAPWEYGPGFAWFEISFSSLGVEANLDQLWASVDQVAELVSMEDPTTTVVGGFSQGSMMTAGLMARHPQLFSTAVLMSGRAVDPASGSFPGRAFQAHGLLDGVVSFREGDQLRSDLTVMGDRHQFHAYEMGHSVCQEEIDDLNAWLRA